jgi:hypothetical protein
MARRRTKPRIGRPPLFGERMKRVDIMLSEDDLERAAEIGKGNVSRGIRLALTEHRKTPSAGRKSKS